MLAKAYLDLQDKQRKEIEEFPIAYAFNNEQLKEALKKLGNVELSDCCTVMNHGDIMLKKDAKRFIAMLRRHNKEVHDLLKSDNDIAYEAFLYEMENHEYAINWDGDYDVLSSLGMNEKDLDEMGLQCIYQTARRKYFELADENGWY